MSEFASRLTDAILKWFPLVFGLGVLAVLVGYVVLGILHLRRERRKRRARAALLATMKHHVTEQIMETVLPMERAAKYEKPLTDALERLGIGVVTGGGTQLTKNGAVQWVEITIALLDLEAALNVTRDQLRRCGAPSGSTLKYSNSNQQVTVPI
jgi:hypothetical protein